MLTSGQTAPAGPPAPAARPATYREVLARPEFRAIWLAQALSAVGDQLAQVALAVLVYARTGSPLLTAVTYALTFLPPLLGGPLLSGLADMFPRRRVMVACDLLRAGLVGVMALPGLPYWALWPLVFTTVLVGAPFSAARAALLPDVLPGDAYVVGSALIGTTFQAANVVGFLVGGGLVALLGTHRALAVDAATFVLSALALARGVRPRPAPARGDGRDGRLSLTRIAREGTRVVFTDPRLRRLILFAWLTGCYIMPEGLAVPYAKDLGSGPLAVGVLLAAMPLGSAAGMLAFSRLVTPARRIKAMGAMAMLACGPLVVCGLRPPLWATVALWVLAGIGTAYHLAANAAFVRCVPAATRGLAFGLAQSSLQVVQGLGIVAGGAMAQGAGPAAAVAAGGAVGLVAAGLLALDWSRRRDEVVARLEEQAA